MKRTNEQTSRRDLSGRSKSLTPGYILEPVNEDEERSFLVRGRLAADTYTDSGIVNYELAGAEILDTAEEELKGRQIAEKKNNKWREADLALEGESSEDLEYRLFQYDGEDMIVTDSEGLEDEELEKEVQRAFKSISPHYRNVYPSNSRNL